MIHWSTLMGSSILVISGHDGPTERLVFSWQAVSVKKGAQS